MPTTIALILSFAAGAIAADQPQWGERNTRNMVSSETGLPTTFDPETGANVRWSIPLGSHSYSTPIVASGRVLIGTNNHRPRDPKHQGDRGVLFCLDESDGHLLWQLVVPKMVQDNFLDWQNVGIVSPPTVEGDRVYIPTNRGEVLCLDLDGMKDGNDGPYKDEGRHAVLPGETPIEIGELDADIVWVYDAATDLSVRLHDQTHASVLIDGPLLYLCSSNGVDGTHRLIPSPEAPSLIVLEKATGRLIAIDDESIGPNIVHCMWSSPAMAVVDGRKLIFFAGSDAILYAFEALDGVPEEKSVQKLKLVWKFDCDTESLRGDLQKYQGNRRVGPSTIIGMPVVYGGKIYVTVGGDYWHGKLQAWVKCIDPRGKGDITATNLVWSGPIEKHCMSTPSIADGLLFISDCGRHVTCFDAVTGEKYWSHATKGDIWGSTMVADGKVYVGTRRAGFWTFAASKEMTILSRISLDSPVSATPTPANGTLYVATMERLYAVAQPAAKD